MPTSHHDVPSTNCPCGLTVSYQNCCGPLHSGQRPAASPVQLMRSRYTAFALGDEPYLLRSWHPRTRPATLGLESAGRRPRWLRLEILAATDGGAFGTEATVEFRAYYQDAGQPGDLWERSRFVRHEGAWVYLDGAVEGVD